MRIDPTLPAATAVGRPASPATATSLVEELSRDFGAMIDEVNSLSLEADRKVEEFATSPHKDIHGTMIALEKASLSLRLMLQVRAKLTNAFQEVMRTPL
jgi:flagellar hook-basal body complex protein FliE